MRRYTEPLAFGLASLAVTALGWVPLWVASGLGVYGNGAASMVASDASWLVSAGGIAILGYVAGQRRSRADLVAVVVFPFVALVVVRVMASLV